MKIFSWNVNGLRAVIRKGQFQAFIDKYQPDVLCLQETKAKQGQAEIDLPDYEEFWNSADRPGYAGTAIFVKNENVKTKCKSVNVKLENEKLTDQYGNLNKEGRIITVEFDEFFLVSHYTPNAKDDLSRLEIRQKWDQAFLDYVKELHKQKPVIFCGDLNVAHQEIDLARPKDNVGKHGFTDEERASFQNYLDAGFVDVFRKTHGDEPGAYTWWTFRANARARNVGWRIDYFLATSDIAKRITKAEIHPEQMGSDHCPISIEISS